MSNSFAENCGQSIHERLTISTSKDMRVSRDFESVPPNRLFNPIGNLLSDVRDLASPKSDTESINSVGSLKDCAWEGMTSEMRGIKSCLAFSEWDRLPWKSPLRMYRYKPTQWLHGADEPVGERDQYLDYTTQTPNTPAKMSSHLKMQFRLNNLKSRNLQTARQSALKASPSPTSRL